MKRIFAKISTLLLLLTCQASFATTLLNVVTNGTRLIITPIANHTYPKMSIQMNSTEYCLTDLDNNCVASALFSASKTSPKIFSITGPADPHLSVSLTICVNDDDPLTCKNYTTNNNPIAYVSNFGNDSVSLCSINSDGTFGDCGNSGIAGTPFKETYQMALNASGTIAYVVDRRGLKIYRCSINVNGTFSTCIDSGNTGVSFKFPSGIALNSAGTMAYVTNQTGGGQWGISACPINADGSFGACVPAWSAGPRFNIPNGITLNKAGTIAYIANFASNIVFMCPINANGTFEPCTDSGNNGVAFAGPFGIILNNVGNIAYITNANNNTVSMCPINANGTFGTCVNAGNSGIAFDGPRGLALNSTETIAYVTNFRNDVMSTCPVNSDGTFGVCASADNSGVELNAPHWITLPKYHVAAQVSS